MVKITREKTDAGPWLSAVESAGGGSLPDWWTVDSTPGSESVEFAGAVTISPSDEAVSRLTLVETETGATVNDTFQVIDAYGNQAASLRAWKYPANTNRGGNLYLAAATDANVQVGTFALYGSGFIDVSVDLASVIYPILFADYATGDHIFMLTAAGNPVFAGNAETAIGDIQASNFSFWLDDTNGAAKLKIKAKSANGTVVVGEVALA